MYNVPMSSGFLVQTLHLDATRKIYIRQLRNNRDLFSLNLKLQMRLLATDIRSMHQLQRKTSKENSVHKSGISIRLENHTRYQYIKQLRT